MPRFRKPADLAQTVLVSLGIAALIALAGFLAVHSLLAAQASELRNRSLLYAFGIARDVQALVGTRGNPDLSPFEGYVRLSGLLYAQVVSGDDVLLDVAMADGADAFLDDVSRPSRLPGATMQRIRGLLVVDVFFPYGPTRMTDAATPAYSVGIVRLGVNAQDLAERARRATTWAAVAGAVVWGAASATLSALQLRRARRRGPAVLSAEDRAAVAGRTRSAGDLRLFYDACRLDVAGQPVELTPKLRDLLWLLFSSPGRAFSDAEILADVWRDSPYADSRDVKQHVYLIRRRLAAAGLQGDRILANVPGQGYRVVSDPAERLLDPRIDPRSIDAPPSASKDE